MPIRKKSRWEHVIEMAILKYLNSLHGCYAFKVETRGSYDPKNDFHRSQDGVVKGTADIIGVYWGVFFAFEIKKPKGVLGNKKSKTYPSKEQKKFIHEIRSRAGVAFVIRSISEAKQAIIWIRKNKKLQAQDDLEGFDINGGA